MIPTRTDKRTPASAVKTGEHKATLAEEVSTPAKVRMEQQHNGTTTQQE